ncbi:MAG: ABC transporter permease subunit [Acidobacteriota bacterium]
MFTYLIIAFFLISALPFAAAGTLDDIRERGVLLWGGDAEGGAPYTFPDPEDPTRLMGFEVEIAQELALRLGVRQQMVQTPWSTLPQALMREDFDIILNGLEITPERRRYIDFTQPYYEFHEALMVREAEQGIHDLADLQARRVGTLSGALAGDILRSVQGVNIVWYDDNVAPYRDLALGRLEAVLMDFPISHYYGEKVPGLKYVGGGFGSGLYAIGIRKQDALLQRALNAALEEMKTDGSLHRILMRWGLSGGGNVQFESKSRPLTIYLPVMLQAAAMTMFISVTSMILAVALGLLLCCGRVYGPWPLQKAALLYVEFFRGTPLLLQLLVIYFGLPALGLALPAWAAGIIGLALNYAAYESEIYRAAISAVPAGQMEAALSLGMTRTMSVRQIILPQAVRVSIPGSTNDFIALFKESSLLSVIGVMELTKQFNILAISTWRVLELGILTGALYLLMSYPLSLLARRWERQLAAGDLKVQVR